MWRLVVEEFEILNTCINTNIVAKLAQKLFNFSLRTLFPWDVNYPFQVVFAISVQLGITSDNDGQEQVWFILLTCSITELTHVIAIVLGEHASQHIIHSSGIR